MTPDPTPDRHREAREHACDWPGCQGQCHTGSTCPCHPSSPAGPEEPREGLREAVAAVRLDASDSGLHGLALDKTGAFNRGVDALVTSETAETLGTFSEHRKTATTRISDFTVPPGTPFQTPEGLRAEDEDTRVAFDVQGGVYPIRESVFRASYSPAGPEEFDTGAEERLRAAAQAVVDYQGMTAGRLPRLIDALRAALSGGSVDEERDSDES